MMPQIAIICENTLSSMALRSLLLDVVSDMDIVYYKSVDELRAESPRVAHFFVSAGVLFRNPEFFHPHMQRTFVLTEGEASPFVQSGFKTIDVTVSEQHIVRQIMEIHSTGHPSGHPMNICPVHHGETSRTPLLSSREKDVLALLVKGFINKEIAEQLKISLTTVVFHRNNISEKLNTRSIGRLTVYAVLNNIVSLSDI